MDRQQKFALFFVLAFFFFFPAFSMEIRSIFPIAGLHWTLETTSGLQNIGNSAKFGDYGNELYVKQILSAKGILFRSFFDNILLTSSQLNLGFYKKTDFLWTDRPDFEHETTLNMQLRSIEFDVQKFFPVVYDSRFSLSMFGAYSYFKISVEKFENGLYGKTLIYNSFSGGIQGMFAFSKKLSQTGYASYSPLVVYGYRLSTIQFFNFGFEFRTETYPVSFTLFYNGKHAFRQKGRTFFEGLNRNMNSREIGFSFHLNLRNKMI